MKVRRDFGADEDCEPVIVPRNDKSLVAVAPERVRRLREHLVGILREMRTDAVGAYRLARAARSNRFPGTRGANGLFAV